MSPRVRKLYDRKRWTTEAIIAAIHDADKELGRRPGQVDFDPAHARRLGHFERAAVTEEMIAEDRWPSHHTVAEHFGSWNKAMVAAGYKPRTRGSTGQDAESYQPTIPDDRRPA